MPKQGKSYKEDFSKFFEAPSREGLRNLLRGQLGEFDACDFKIQWPSPPKIARHVLGLANSRGGCLVIGVGENRDKTFEIAGLSAIGDKAEVQKSIQKFIPSQLKYELLDFAYDDSEYPKLIGKKFQVLIVEDSAEYIPFISRSNGDGIRENAIYIRRGTSSEEVNYEELQEIINRRIETGFSTRGEFDLKKHLSELNSLYEHIQPSVDPYSGDEYFATLPLHFVENPYYPKESFESFVKKLIIEKKLLIRHILLGKNNQEK
jgi:hypothetical protein